MGRALGLGLGIPFGGVPRVLPRAVAYWDARYYSGTGALLDLARNTHHAQLGSTSGADSNDPLFLSPVEGKPYLYLPGTNGNWASVADAAALDVTGDLQLIGRYDGTKAPAASVTIGGKWDTPSNQRSYLVQIGTTGLMVLGVSSDGTNTNQDFLVSTSPLGAGDRWWKIEWTAATGTAVFYDGGVGASPAWVSIGTDSGPITAIHAGTATLGVGAFNNAGTGAPGTFGAKVFQVFNGIGGTKVFDVDFADAAAYNATRTSLTAVTGQTVTINRGTSGRKASVVDRPLFLLGTDDYFEVADHNDLDFGAAGSFTIVALYRTYGVPNGTRETYIGKKAIAGSGAAGRHITSSTVTLAALSRLSDGATQVANNSGAPVVVEGRVTALVQRVNRTAQTQETKLSSTTDTSSASVSGVGSTSNAEPLRIGATGGVASEFVHAEFFGAAVFAEALSDAALSRLYGELGVAG